MLLVAVLFVDTWEGLIDPASSVMTREAKECGKKEGVDQEVCLSGTRRDDEN